MSISSDLTLALSAYIPRWIRDRLARPNPITPGYSEQFEAAVLFCDLAGFTSLTEALAASEEAGQKGKGIEQLQSVLNKLFTALIDVAHDYGGDVVRFSGDALTVLFGDYATSDQCAQHTQRALACALDMQRAIAPMAHFQLDGTPYPLQMKIGLGAGPVLAALVGHPKHGEDMLLTGPALSEATVGEKHAQRSDIVISADTLQYACINIAGKDTSKFVTLHPDDPRLQTLGLPAPERSFDLWDFEPGESGQHLAAFVPAPIVERLRMKVGELLPEFKRVTAMFAAFAGPDYANDPQAATKVQDYISAAQDIITHYKGYLVEVEAGDKGSLLMILFGAPLADERDAIHAARCALELKELPGTLYIGIASGRVFAGTVGAPLRKRYTTIGAAVNRAARLMQTATSGQILADQNTVALSSRVIAYTSLPPVTLKGMAEPVPIHLVDGEQTNEAARAGGRLIGRDEELAQLLGLLDLARDQRAQIITLEGEAGVGKSRLAIELRLRAHQTGWHVFGGTCQSTGAQTPYLPWNELLRQVLGLQANQSPEAHIVTIAQALHDIDPAHGGPLLERLPLLGPVLRLPIPDNDLTRHLDARLRRDGTFALVGEILRARLAKSPLLLVLEDAHWADPLSLELTVHLARELAPEKLGLLLVQRPYSPPLPPLITTLRQHPAHTLIELGALPAGQGPELACISLGVTALPREIEQIILERGQGNPFFIEEIARMVRESGVVTRDPDSGELKISGSLEKIQIPDTVEKLVQGRIDQLDEQSRLTIKVASIIGREFQYVVLLGIYPPTITIEKAVLHQQLDGLEQRDLIQLEIPEPILAYVFKHIITREVTYESLLFAQRRMLHEAVAQWHERTYIDNLSPHYTTLAYHYERTENHPKQLEYFAKAGQQAAQEYANDAARGFFTKALVAATRVPDADANILATIYEGLGDLYNLAGEFDDSYHQYQKAHTALEPLPVKQAYLPLARLHRKMGRVREQQGKIPEAFEHLEQGLQLLQAYQKEPNAAQEMARLYQQGGLTHTRRGDSDKAQEWAAKALQAVQHYDFPAELAQIYNLFVITSYMRGDIDKAIEYGIQSTSLYERLGDKLGAAKAYSNLGMVYSQECNWERSLEYYQHSLQLRQQIGDVTGIGFVYNNIGNVQLWHGANLEDAISALKEAEQISTDSGLHYLTLGAQASLGEAYLHQGQIESATRYIKNGITLAERTGITTFTPFLNRLYAQVHLANGELALSKEWIAHALQMAEEQQQRDVAGETWCTLGKLYRQQGELDKAQEAIEKSRAILQELNLQRQLGQTILEEARLRREQGYLEEARQLAQEAMNIFQRVDAQWDLAQAEQLGKQLQSDPPHQP